MYITRRNAAKPYPADKHHGMAALRLQGREASPAKSAWVGLSLFLPGGGAERGASPTEKIYVVISGEITVVTQDHEVTLGALDSILLEANETRSLENRSSGCAEMLVFSPG